MKTLLVAGSAIVVALVGALAPLASATSYQGYDLTTSPIAVSLNAKPGSSVSTTLEVENDEPVPVLINVKLETFKSGGNSGQPQLLAPTSSDTFLNWVQFSRTSFIAQPSVWTPVKMTINFPTSASLDYYYTVLFEPSSSFSKTTNQEKLKSVNYILVLANAESGNAKPSLQVTSFSANKKLFEYLPVNFNVNVYNDGNVYLAPTGDIFISQNSNFSGNVGTIPINTYAGNVLPGTSRIYSADWSDGFPVFKPKMIDGHTVVNEKGQVEQQLNWNFSNTDKFRFGHYYAKLVLAYNNGVRDVPIQATLSFWVIPWKLIGIIFLVVVFTVVGLYVSGEKLADRTYNITKKVRRRR